MRICLFFGFAAALAGCAAPPAFTIASLMADGFSYLASGKGIVDHALSAATQRDCALWNVLKTRDVSAVCRHDDGIGGVTVVAAVSPAHPVDDRRYFAKISYGSAAPTHGPAAISDAPGSAIPAVATIPTSHKATKYKAPNHRATYLVVGSFRLFDNAKRRVARMSASPIGLTTTVVDGEEVHRVVAGPFDGVNMAVARSRAVAAGVAKPWAISLCTTDLAVPPCRVRTELAERTEPLNLAANDAAPAGPAN